VALGVSLRSAIVPRPSRVPRPFPRLVGGGFVGSASSAVSVRSASLGFLPRLSALGLLTL